MAAGLVKPDPRHHGEEAGASNQKGGRAVKADLGPAEKVSLAAVGSGKPLETFYF